MGAAYAAGQGYEYTFLSRFKPRGARRDIVFRKTNKSVELSPTNAHTKKTYLYVVRL